MLKTPSAVGYLLYDGALNADDVERVRNLGCPHYDVCLDAASAELSRRAPARRAKRTWKLGSSARTWVCNPECAHRGERQLFHMELLQSTRER